MTAVSVPDDAPTVGVVALRAALAEGSARWVWTAHGSTVDRHAGVVIETRRVTGPTWVAHPLACSRMLGLLLPPGATPTWRELVVLTGVAAESFARWPLRVEEQWWTAA